MSNNSTMSTGDRAQRRLKNFLLDARFQLKFASYFVALTLVVSALLGVFLYRTTSSLFDQMSESVGARAKAAETSRELGRCALNNELATKMNDPTFAQTLEARSRDIDAAFEAESQNTLKLHAQLVSQQKVTGFALMGGLVLFIVLTAFIAIVITHRIVGPLFRIKRMAREVGSGVMQPPTYGLRPGDELQDVFEIFAAMITNLRARTEGDRQAVDAALTGDRAALEKLKAELDARLARQ